MTSGAGSADGPVGLVLAGGGARGAYEMGALSALLPALEARGERPRVIVGTSVGALNAAFLAATAEQPVDDVVKRGLEIWKEIRFEQVLKHVVSPCALWRLVQYAGQFLGVPGMRLEALLDPTPLRATLERLIPFDAIERNVATDAGPRALQAAAVVATSALTSRSVVFHCGGESPARDDLRGIDYVETPLAEEHVRASAAIPGAFPAVEVTTPAIARGWYSDGGTRLNTPIKPALALGAKSVVVIGLNAIGLPGAAQPPNKPEPLAGPHQPDALEGAGALVQALLVDPLAHDVATLASVNALVGAGGADTLADKERIPYIFVAPREREAIGRIAQQVFKDRYDDLVDTLRARDLAFLGRTVAGSSDPAHGELLSYLFFAPEFARELIALGRADAKRWLAEPHDHDGPWQVGPLDPRGS